MLIMVVLNSLIIPTFMSCLSLVLILVLSLQIVFFLPFGMPCRFSVECQIVLAVIGNRN